MVGFEGNLMNARKSYVQDAPYYQNNQTYKINTYTYGVYQDILEVLENQLNFSTILYKRIDNIWGYVYPQSNGSYITTGIVGDTFLEKVDIVVGPVATNLERSIYVDYLIMLTSTYVGIYIENFKATELIDLHTFTAPFTLKLWLLVLAASILIAIIKIILKYYFGYSINAMDTINLLWTSIIANFGGAPASTKIDNNQSYRLTIFVSLCSGIVIWISYQARLTSELSVIDKKYPFTDFESFSKTNWK